VISRDRINSPNIAFLLRVLCGPCGEHPPLAQKNPPGSKTPLDRATCI